MTDTKKAARADARQALGDNYARRLLAAYAVLLDGEGLIKKYGAREGNIGSAHNKVCQALRNLREAGDIDF